MARNLPSMIVIGTGANAARLKEQDYSTGRYGYYPYGLSIYLVRGRAKLQLVEHLSNHLVPRSSESTYQDVDREERNRLAAQVRPAQPVPGVAVGAMTAGGLLGEMHHGIRAMHALLLGTAFNPMEYAHWQQQAAMRFMRAESDARRGLPARVPRSAYDPEKAFFTRWLQGVKLVEPTLVTRDQLEIPRPGIDWHLLSRNTTIATAQDVEELLARPLEAWFKAHDFLIPVRVVPEVQPPREDRAIIAIDMEA